ncbi:MAG: hypothetical protein Athens101410_338 [Parcubacteria group bacterium Athens1014_10]|nr:MAG: hypothetical protein Athens101410_338 [Parcubacteria group bacterium Athens1014_10]TSD05154.1 MAG: hypothetical protein Athens071412_456 [Parcubacteria group bacterium Athens0714_12]
MEKENQENNLVIKEATLELLKEINQDTEMKRRAEIYADRR